MDTKTTTFPTKMKIDIHFEDLKYCTEIGTFLLFLWSEKPIGLKMQIRIERIGENTILVHFYAGEPENILTTNYRRFSSCVELWEVVC